jgi:stress response protein SCP2
MVGTQNRKARHNISHRIYEDSSGKQHVQVQFNISGQGQRGVVSADMYKEGSEWKSAYLFVDIAGDRIVVQAA